MPRNYETVSEAVNDLIARGYVTNFEIRTEKEVLICDKSSVCLSPDEFIVDEVYRFQGSTDPADEAVVYGISASKHQIKGILVDAFGPYSDINTSKVIQILNERLKK